MQHTPPANRSTADRSDDPRVHMEVVHLQRRSALDKKGAERRIVHALAFKRQKREGDTAASVENLTTTQPSPPVSTRRSVPKPPAVMGVDDDPHAATLPPTIAAPQHKQPMLATAGDAGDTTDVVMTQANDAAAPSPATDVATGTTAKPDSALMPPPQTKGREPEHQRLWDLREELKDLPICVDSAGRVDEIVVQAAGVLANSSWPIPHIKLRSTAADILVHAVERKPTNGALQTIMTAAMDTIRIGRADGTRRAENIATHLWTRIMSLEGTRASLLFKPIIQKFARTNGINGDVARQSLYKRTLQSWESKATETAIPFRAVDIPIFVNQLEKYRFDDKAAQTPLAPRTPNDTTVWRGTALTAPAPPRANAVPFRYVVWNGNGFTKRFNNGDVTDMLVTEQPAVYAMLETRIDTANMANPCTVREFFYAMGYSLVCWNSNKRNYSDHGVLVAVRADLAAEAQIHAGIDEPTSDSEGRVLTIEFDDHAAVIAYAPCTKWGTAQPCARRALFQEVLSRHLVGWNGRKPTMLLGDLNVAPTEADRTYYPPVSDDSTPCDYHPITGMRTMDRKTMSSCKDSERRWHADLLVETDMVDAVCANRDATRPNPISWAKTPGQWAKDEGLRIDHVLAPRVLMADAGFPHIEEARLGTDTHNSDHVAVIVDVARNADHAKTYARIRRDRLDPAELIALAGGVAYATSTETRTAATSTFSTVVGARIPALPHMERVEADEVFLGLIRILGEVDSELDVAFAAAAVPPAPPVQLGQKRCRDDKSQAYDEECIFDDEPLGKEAVAAAILAHVHSAYHSTGSSERGRIYAEVSVTAGHADGTGPTELVQALLDTGAAHGIINQRLASRLQLRLKTHNAPMRFRMADGSTRRSPGHVDLRLTMADDVGVSVNLHVLPDCPYGIIIGNDFLETAGSVLDYRRHEWRFLTDPDDIASEAVIEFTPKKGSAPKNLVQLAETVVVPRHGTVRVPVLVDSTGANNKTDGTTYGFFAGAPSGQFVVCNGVGNVAAENQQNFVTLTNTTNKELTLVKGRTVATFVRDDLDAYDTMLAAEVAPSNEPLMAERRKIISAMSDAELDATIQASKELSPLDLSSAGTMFSPSELRRLKEMTLLHQRLWDESMKPPPPSGAQCTIRLSKEPTLQGHMPHINPKVRSQLKEILDDKLNRGIIEPGHGPYSSTVLLLPKPKGGIRFVLDYRALNDCVKSDAYTLPQVEEVLSALSGSRIFSSLDIKEAFWSVPLDEESKQLTAFRTPLGLFQYTRMPMGLKTASAVFCRFLDGIVGNLRWQTALTYIDDVLVYSATAKEHLDALEILFARLDAANLTLKAAKTQLVRPEIEFLGHVVDQNGVRPSVEKIKAIEAIQLPSNPKELRTALGSFGYYRRFIKDYAKITHPLREKMNVARWPLDASGAAIWSVAERAAFFRIRDCLKTAPILAHPEWTQPFQLHTDASLQGLGAMLTQKQDGKDVAIAYVSRALTKAEQVFAIWELEALAAVWACRLFRMYLYGSRFQIITDSQAVTTILKASYKAAGGRLARWSLALQDFDYELVHRSGSLNLVPDALSRNPLQSPTPYTEGATDVDPPPILVAVRTDDESKSLEMPDGSSWDISCPFDGKAPFFPEGDDAASSLADWVSAQLNDKTCGKIMTLLENPTDHAVRNVYKIDERGLLLRRSGAIAKSRDIEVTEQHSPPNRWTIVVPAKLRAFVMYRYHALPISGHHGRDNTQRNIKRSYYWEGMDKDISRWVRACAVCQRRKQARRLHVGNASSVQAQRPWEKLAIDIVSASTTHAAGMRYILTALDVFTRWVIAVPLRTKKAKDVADAIFTHILCVHGRPDHIITDEGAEFVNSALRYLYKRWGIRPITTGGYQPQALPVERFHRFLNGAMTMLASKFGEDWASYLPAVTLAYNTSVTVSTGYSPFCTAPTRASSRTRP